MTTSYNTSTIIIGAGIAGLYAAYLLKAQGQQVQVLEARPTHGGRVVSIENWADYPIELGAAFIHGKKQIFHDLAKFDDTELSQVKSAPYYYYEGKLYDVKEAIAHKRLKKAHRFFFNLYKYRGFEHSVEEHLTGKKYYESTKDILLGLGYEYGTDLSKLGMGSLAIDENNWHSGNQDFVSKKSFMEVLHELHQPIAEDIKLNTVVKEIDYRNDVIKVVDEKGQEYAGKQLILTVPLSVLKSKSINFTPALPASKIKAIDNLGFDVGMKVFLKFNKRFWPEGLTELYGGKHCPRYEAADMGRTSTVPIMSAYIMGDKAANFSKLSRQEIRDLLLQELDEMFGEQQATMHFQDFLLQDWSKEPHIWGAYSYASVFSVGMRETLAQPLQKRVYFAGEATNFRGHNATLHGAMESAEWAVNAIMNDIKPA